MRHPFLILFAAALLVAGCNNSKNNPDKNNNRNVPSGKEDKAGDNISDDTQASLIPDAVTDIDGNTYNAVQIGDQVWMAESMRATKDRDGQDIDFVSEISYDGGCRYCPNNDPKNFEKYGYLYGWDAAVRVCPKGWHLPTDEEWRQLINYVGSKSQYVCGDNQKNIAQENIAKALSSKEEWESCDESCTVGNDLNSNNATGFGALPAGTADPCSRTFGHVAAFWSATKSEGCDGSIPNCVVLLSCSSDVGYSGDNDFIAQSVRCVRD